MSSWPNPCKSSAVQNRHPSALTPGKSFQLGCLLLLLWIASGCPAAPVAAAQEKDASIARGSSGGSAYYGESWALLIGIDRYQPPRIPPLKYAVNVS